MSFSPTQIRRRIRTSLFLDGRVGILAAVSFGWFLFLGVRLVVPVLFPGIRDEFLFNNTLAGSMYTILLAVAALLQFPGGLIADRVGGRAVLVLGCGAAILGVSLLTTAPVVWVFVLGIVLFGVGTGLYGTPRVTVLSSVYPDQDATAIGICSGSGNVGTTVLPVAAGVLAAVFGWRFGFGVAFIPFALCALLIWRYVPPNAGKPRPPQTTPGTFTPSSRDFVTGLSCSPRSL